MINLRSMQPSDQEHVSRLLHQLWGNNPLMLAQYRTHRADWPAMPNLLRKTLVVERKAELVAVGTVFVYRLKRAAQRRLLFC